jgi:hypothetical protein
VATARSPIEVSATSIPQYLDSSWQVDRGFGAGRLANVTYNADREPRTVTDISPVTVRGSRT